MPVLGSWPTEAPATKGQARNSSIHNSTPKLTDLVEGWETTCRGGKPSRRYSPFTTGSTRLAPSLEAQQRASDPRGACTACTLAAEAWRDSVPNPHLAAPVFLGLAGPHRSAKALPAIGAGDRLVAASSSGHGM